MSVRVKAEQDSDYLCIFSQGRRTTVCPDQSKKEGSQTSGKTLGVRDAHLTRRSAPVAPERALLMHKVAAAFRVESPRTFSSPGCSLV